ncbi:DUF6491 family protein [Brevundimonas sp. NIBR11]|uniref:DUF6491 family protein n=1 Tax=Brevundimonas sp. NIBR11 TaxID=3015999 RepID=UPI0022F043AC|nr:DUF6491 family protein [Brevundimonas sp. NIBR11]WGM29987.1 hypothetical protein KKHFBJBL_00202 [Brevundimonas sp. NIBR11]
MRRSITVLLFATAVAGCAPTDGPAPSPRFTSVNGQPVQCFQPARIQNFRTEGQQRLYVRALGGAVFELSSAGCFDLGTANTLAITPSVGIADRLCVGDGARIALSNSTGQGPCYARVVRSLTAAEIEALPSRSRP